MFSRRSYLRCATLSSAQARADGSQSRKPAQPTHAIKVLSFFREIQLDRERREPPVSRHSLGQANRVHSLHPSADTIGGQIRNL
jgi:hypothetical protein